MTPDERFDRMHASVVRDGRIAELRTDMGNPATLADARRIFRSLPDFDGRLDLDRSILELKYGDEIEWGE